MFETRKRKELGVESWRSVVENQNHKQSREWSGEDTKGDLLVQ